MPRTPARCGGNPLASSRDWSRPMSASSSPRAPASPGGYRDIIRTVGLLANSKQPPNTSASYFPVKSLKEQDKVMKSYCSTLTPSSKFQDRKHRKSFVLAFSKPSLGSDQVVLGSCIDGRFARPIWNNITYVRSPYKTYGSGQVPEFYNRYS
jgi:hypothetical protein